MYRAYGPGPSLWETVLPKEALLMPAELARVDKLLDDPVFLEPCRDRTYLAHCGTRNRPAGPTSWRLYQVGRADRASIHHSGPTIC